ncbi:MAG: energy transducer TonB [Acidobacteria bacterium]|nr:energy transducer TonB [Acidobacteriota bacterium]
MILKNSCKGILLFLVFACSLWAQSKPSVTARVNNPTGPAIVSPTYPKDSRGEVVYETQGENQKDVPIVDGILAPPSSIKLPQPKFPKSFKHWADFTLTVNGVIAQNGDFIDATILEATEPDIAKCALDAVTHWKFHPGTLDGKPVAQLARIVIQFRI